MKWDFVWVGIKACWVRGACLVEEEEVNYTGPCNDER